MKLVKEYHIVSRDEVVEICDQVALQIQKILTREDVTDKAPILIIVNGSPGMGKSIFWDRIRDVLLEHGGIFIQKDSNSTEESDRLYETWTGELKENGKPVKIFCANMHQGTEQTMNDLVGSESLHLLGDIIILSNTPEEMFNDNQINYRISMDMDLQAIKKLVIPSGWEMSLKLETLKPI